MACVLKYTLDDFAADVVGIRDKIDLLCQLKAVEQMQHFIKQGLLASIREYSAFVDLHIQRYSDYTAGGVSQQRYHLTGMAYSAGRIAFVVRFLMQAFYAGYLATMFGDFLAIAKNDEPAIDALGLMSKQLYHAACPQDSQSVQLNATALEMI